jgi:hypothetical protein
MYVDLPKLYTILTYNKVYNYLTVKITHKYAKIVVFLKSIQKYICDVNF